MVKQIRELLIDVCRYHHESGNSAEATEFFNVARTAAETIKSSNLCEDDEQRRNLDTLLGEIHHNLGCVGTETNEPESTLRHFQQFKDIVLNQDSKNAHESRLAPSIAWNELGNAWMLNKNWLKGEECFHKSIETAIAAGTKDPTEMSFPKVNLGLAYWLTDRHAEAAATVAEALREREAKYGKDDKDSFM